MLDKHYFSEILFKLSISISNIPIEFNAAVLQYSSNTSIPCISWECKLGIWGVGEVALLVVGEFLM